MNTKIAFCWATWQRGTTKEKRTAEWTSAKHPGRPHTSSSWLKHSNFWGEPHRTHSVEEDILCSLLCSHGLKSHVVVTFFVRFDLAQSGFRGECEGCLCSRHLHAVVTSCTQHTPALLKQRVRFSAACARRLLQSVCICNDRKSVCTCDDRKKKEKKKTLRTRCPARRQHGPTHTQNAWCKIWSTNAQEKVEKFSRHSLGSAAFLKV